MTTFDELLETQAGTQDNLTPIEQHNGYWVTVLKSYCDETKPAFFSVSYAE